MARRVPRLLFAARLCTTLLSTALLAAVLIAPPRALASDTFFDQKCAACHPQSANGPTCAGCHSHGVHGTTARNEINFKGTTGKTSYAANETVTVTVNGGNQGGWLRTTLVDQNGLELGRTTGPNTMGGGPALPVTLSGAAPGATGMYTWQVRWFGNQYDAGAATFGKPGEWIASWEPNHGYQVGYTNAFFVGSVPKLALAPAALDFGAIAVGANESLTTTLQSVGNVSVTVSAVGRCSGTSAAYTTTPAAPFTIPAGGSQVLTVRYAPTAAATDNGCIAITSNDLYSAVTNLPVTGVASSTPQPTVALSPNPLDFGGVPVSSTAQRTLSVINTGTGPLTVSALAVGVGEGPVYSWSPAPPFTVAAGATQAVTVTYAPLWEWIDDTTITVTSNAVNTPSASVAVKATGYIQPVQSCTSCHGDANRTPAVISAAPPVDTKGNTLAIYPGVGAHMTHLTSTRITGVPGSCTDCHASPTGTHPSGATEFSWSPLARMGGVAPAYDFVTNTCASTYCHGATLAGGTNKAPKWTQLDGTQAACGTCHGIPPPDGTTHSGMSGSTACGSCHTGFTATTVNVGLHVNGVVDAANMTCTSCHGTPGRAGGTGDSGANPVAAAPPVDAARSSLTTSPGVGAHVAHLTGTRLNATPVPCAECHVVPTSQTHANGTHDLAWGALTRTGGLSPSFNTTTFTCSNTWCHGGTPQLLGGTNTTPIWTKVDGTQATCGTCHGNPPPAPHVQNTACGSCHTGYTQTTVNATQHLNGVIDYTAQSCTTCHGAATRSGGTGATGTNPVASSPPADTLGGSATTARGVGAHVVHLTSTRLSANAVACAECHTVPTTNTHANGARDLAWGNLTRTGGLSPTFNTTSFTCSNTWCHGGTTQLLGGSATAPVWTRVDGTQATCGSCHGDPPSSPAHTGFTATTNCGTCHTGYTATSVNAATHLDGTIQYVAQTCTTCHGTVGRAANTGLTGTVDANLASAPPVDVAGTTTGVRVGTHVSHVNPTTGAQSFRPLACTDCHPNHAGNTAHANGVQDVTMATIGGIAPAVVKSTGTTPATCTTYCHGAKWATGDAHKGARTSWAWNGANAACGDCHAYPPANAGHAGVTATTNCGNCHAGYTATTVSMTLHINGVADVSTQTCTSCHGTAGRAANAGLTGTVDANLASAPPIDVAGTTSGVRVGTHVSHVNPTAGAQSFRPLACTDCHPNNAGNNAHSNGVQDVTMATIGGIAPAVVKSSGTTPATCTTYCHGAKWATGDAHKGARTSWAWNGANAACGDCHAYPPANSGHSGVTSSTNCGNCHTGYTATTVSMTLHINGVADVNAQTCTSCHGSTSHSAGTGASGTNPVAAAPPVDTIQNSVTTARGVGAHIAHLTGTRFSSAAVGCSECHPVPTSMTHSNSARDLTFGTLTRTGGLSPSFNTTTFTCSSTWCHGNTPSLLGGTVTQPQWTKVDGTQAACGTCHGNPPPAPHVQSTACASCHTGYSQTAVNMTLHLNGVIDYTTQSCTTCHGTSTRTGGTGATGANPVASAPPADTRAGSATTARGVGAHVAHLTGTTLSAASMVCSDCHVVPTSTTHANGTTANPYGQVIFSSRSTSAGTTAAAWSTTAFTCSNSICHGSTTLGGTNKTPNWTVVNGTQAACGTCHGIPPPAPHAQNSTCGSCHTGYTSTTVNKTLHLNFTIDQPTTSCTSCHGTQNRVANSGIGTTDANFASAPPVDASGSSTSVKVGDHIAHLNPTAGAQLYRPLLCTDCHPNNTSTSHSNSVLDVTLATIATYPGSVVKSSGTTPATCTTYCHGSKWPTGDAHKGARTSWTWNGANAACGDCHAYPPTTSGHNGVTSTTNCGGCHTGYTATTVNLSLHINGVGDAPIGGEPVSGGTSCGACHKTIFDGMTGGVTKVSKHTLGGGDAPTAGTASWTTAANLKASPNYATANCVSMCHGDHPHTVSGVTTHPYNAYSDANSRGTAASTTTRSSKDFDSTQSSGGLCTSCHRIAVAAGRQAVGTSYSGTAHQYTSKTVGTATYTWQYTLHDGGAFGRDCTKCHASQAEGRTPTSNANSSGNVGPHSSDFGALLAGSRNAGTTPANLVCYNCHGNGTTGLNTSGKDLATAVSRGATTSGGSHKSMSSETVHDTAREASATWNNGSLSGTRRHANCLDCHSTHLAKTGLVSRTATATSTRNQLPPSMAGATGVAYGTYPTMPTTACASGATLPNACFTQTTASSFGTNPAVATYEYQVCFKCHSSFAFGNTTFPTATGASGLQTTDTAAEFSPTNRSGHPVVTGLSSYTGNTAPKALVAAQLLAPWNVNVGTQTMLCSDCHNTDAASPAAQGPHGSAITYMLSGANKAWPYTVAGATSGTLFRVSTSETGINTNNGLFCRNCHPQQNSTASNSVHRNSNVTGGQHGSSNNVAACTACHIRVPHGGKLSRLFVTTNAPARYKIGTPAFSQVTKNASGKDGYGTGWPAGMRSSCSQHSSQTGSETW
ncbi:MAG TPA: CxxxxCH/CxxCH domain-containing protein [Anaeromyxobacteraceae bacterium]|nr:CxxxxCH/CxxCH domain-containing protein [Anaeromyxobacteraceae bacterium]